jgi:hypothetical protein
MEPLNFSPGWCTSEVLKLSRKEKEYTAREEDAAGVHGHTGTLRANSQLALERERVLGQGGGGGEGVQVHWCAVSKQ